MLDRKNIFICASSSYSPEFLNKCCQKEGKRSQTLLMLMRKRSIYLYTPIISAISTSMLVRTARMCGAICGSKMNGYILRSGAGHVWWHFAARYWCGNQHYMRRTCLVTLRCSVLMWKSALHAQNKPGDTSLLGIYVETTTTYTHHAWWHLAARYWRGNQQ